MTALRQQVLVTLTTNPQSTTPLSGNASFPVANIGSAWTGTIFGVGGTGTYGYSLVAKPAWMTANTVGNVWVLTGTPGISGVVTVDISDGVSTQRCSFNLNVRGSISGGGGEVFAIQAAYTSLAYSFDPATLLNNPTLPLTSVVVSSGTLPTGMSVVSNIITASSVTGTTQDVTLTVTDGASKVAVLPLRFQVKPAMAVSTYAPAGVLGQAYNGKVTVTGGSGQYSIIPIAANPLPSGLSVAPRTGAITGQPLALSPTTGAVATHFIVTDLVTGQQITTTLIGGSKAITVGSPAAPAPRGFYAATNDDGSTLMVDSLGSDFGDGGDGVVTVSSGTTTLTRPMFYDTLTISGTGKINAAGFDIFCRTLLDITAAGAQAIYCSQNGGPLPLTVSAAGAPFGADGGASVAGGVNAGTTGNSGNGLVVGVSGGAQGGPGGAGNPGGLGAVAAAKFPTVQTTPPRNAALLGCMHIFPGLAAGVTAIDTVPIGGACGGGSGGGGGGNGSAAGGASGTGGGGGGRIRISARSIARSASTAAGAIDASGFKGAAGTNGPATNRGGGGGGAGGGGGYIDITHAGLTGATATNSLRASGGDGNDGGTSAGAGSTQGTGGDGGPGGAVAIRDILNGTVAVSVGTSGTAHSGRIGGAGNVFQVSL